MFINVGRFRFRSLSEDKRERLVRTVDQEVSPVLRDSPGFRGFYVVRVGDDELMTVWLWESEEQWKAALPPFGPFLRDHVLDELAEPPERANGEVVIEVTR